MSLNRIPATVVRPALAFLVALALVASNSPHHAAGGDGPSGFFALTGDDARAFVLPADLRLAKTFPLDAYGLTYERYEQFLGPAQVAGAEVTIYRDSSGAVAGIIGSHYPGIAPAASLRQSPAAAAAVAEREFGPAASRNVKLMIDPATGRRFHRVESRRFAERWVHWIDAEDGRVLKSYDAIQHDHGTGVKGDTKTMLGPNGTASTADDISTFHGVAGHGPSGPHWDLFSTDNRQFTYDAHNTPVNIYYTTDLDNHWDLLTSDGSYPGQPALVDAQYYADVSDRYYITNHGLDWIADCGYAGMQSIAHYKNNYDNAFWEGTYVVYGDGDGTTSREYSGALDVVAHEHGHGVTECTSNLDYVNQPGALNESFSDIMGNSAEFFANEPLSSNCVLASGQTACADWLVGEDIDLVADAKPGFRNMADPEEDFSNSLGAPHPDHFSEFIVTGLDSGGVHVNSAIPNHAYFLLVNGGLNASCAAPGHNAAHCSDGDTQDNNLNVAGVGLADAEDIFFLGFTGLPTNATFCQARAATETAAGTLFGPSSQQRRSTIDAWVAVGLTDTACGIANTGPSASSTSVYTVVNDAAGVILAGEDAEQCELTFLIVTPPANGSLSAIIGEGCSAGAPSSDTAFVTYSPNPAFNGTDSFTYRVDDGSWYSNTATITATVFVDDSDTDNDTVSDTAEVACGGARVNPTLRPERVDGIFAGVDDDGDTAIDEALPGGAANFDCDGDGFKGAAEDHVYSYVSQLTGDQKTCQQYDAAFPNSAPHVRPSLRWPADVASSAFSLNKLNIQDLSAFTAPIKYLNQDVGTNPADVRFDLVPGSTFGADINVADLAALTSGTSGFPPMLGGARAFGGPVCPYAP